MGARQLFTALVIGLVACGGGGGGNENEPENPEPEVPEPEVFTVTMTAWDSLAGRALSGLTVTAGTESALTDANGVATVELEAGSYPLGVSAVGYEAFNRTLTVSGNGHAGRINLRRLRPFVKAFSSSGGQGVVQVVDLQGRSTIDQSNSYVSTGPNIQFLGPWPAAEVNSVTSNITFPITGTPVNFLFVFKDLDGNVGQFACSPPAPCSEQ